MSGDGGRGEPPRDPAGFGASRPDAFRSPETRAAEYSAWADRLKAKRARAQAAFAGHTSDQEPTAEPSYWSTDSLYAESRRVAEQGEAAGPAADRRRELFAVFNLFDGSTAEEVGEAYRRLAKLHHPDRYATAPPDVQAHHEEEMRRLNVAYTALRRELGR